VNRRATFSVPLALAFYVAGPAVASVDTAQKAIQIAKKECGKTTLKGWFWSATRRDDQWYAYYSNDGIKRYCNMVSVTINVKDGSLVRHGAPGNLDTCVFCMH
jgi:hypothetical protein